MDETDDACGWSYRLIFQFMCDAYYNCYPLQRKFIRRYLADRGAIGLLGLLDRGEWVRFEPGEIAAIVSLFTMGECKTLFFQALCALRAMPPYWDMVSLSRGSYGQLPSVTGWQHHLRRAREVNQ
jgi:hypothetical protein